MRQRVVVRNASGAPAHNVRGIVHDVFISDSEDFENAPSTDHIYTLGPQEQVVIWTDEGDVPDGLMNDQGEQFMRLLSAEIWFEDAKGRTWKRGLGGEPERVKEKRLREFLRSGHAWLRLRTAELQEHRRPR